MRPGSERPAWNVAAMRADARAIVEAATPIGWEAVMIRSPWPEHTCPSCLDDIAVENLGIAVLTRRLERPRVILFALAIVCDGCVGDGRALGALAARTFE